MQSTEPKLPWFARAKAWLVLQPIGTAFTADDLTEAVGMPDEPNKVGAYFSGWASQGYIRAGLVQVPSLRPGSKGAKVTIWERVRR